ncbi:MAG: hypothetical protein ABI037_06645, partial [Gemmatimonadales bacterium]
MRARDSHRPGCYAFAMALLTLSACTTPDKVALKQYAPQSPDADIEAVSLSASSNDNFEPSRVGTEFPDTTQQVAVWYKWNGADSGKKVAIRWTKGGEVVLDQSDTLLKASGASSYVLKMAAGSKLPIGDYQVELLEDGVAVTKIPFKVGAGESGGADVAATATGAGAETEEEGEAQPAATTEESPGDTTEVRAAAAEPAVAAATAAAEAAGPPPSSGGAVLAMHETKWPGVLVELTELTRKGSTLYAKLRFTNKGAKEIRPDFYYRDTFVLDENNKKYEVLKDEKDAYLGSVASGYTYWWGENIDPGASRT